jgi:hypothetical protein
MFSNIMLTSNALLQYVDLTTVYSSLTSFKLLSGHLQENMTVYTRKQATVITNVN